MLFISFAFVRCDTSACLRLAGYKLKGARRTLYSGRQKLAGGACTSM